MRFFSPSSLTSQNISKTYLGGRGPDLLKSVCEQHRLQILREQYYRSFRWAYERQEPVNMTVPGYLKRLANFKTHSTSYGNRG